MHITVSVDVVKVVSFYKMSLQMTVSWITCIYTVATRGMGK